MSTKPENLYAWTDNNVTGTPLYTAPPTVYTDSITLTAGMTLYDNTGTDSGYQVSKISNDNFELGQYSVTFDINDQLISNFVLDGVTYTSGMTLKMSEGTHSLIINGNYASVIMQSNKGTSISISTISGGIYNGSLVISSGIIKEGTNNYEFGTCPITLTISGSINSGGGSN